MTQSMTYAAAASAARTSNGPKPPIVNETKTVTPTPIVTNTVVMPDVVSLLTKSSIAPIDEAFRTSVHFYAQMIGFIHPEETQNLMITRGRELVLALNAAGLKLRYDSILCKRFIEGTVTNHTIPEIVKRMAEMRYLFQHCNMKQRLNDEHERLRLIPKEYITNLEKWTKSDPNEMTNPVFQKLEKQILEEIGGYPTTWPWLERTFYYGSVLLK